MFALPEVPFLPNYPQVDYKDLFSALTESCHEMGIQMVPAFQDKVIQLYETTIVRHGLMLVGPTMGGKTCCYRGLQKAMTKLRALGNEKYEKVGPTDEKRTGIEM